MVRFSAVSPIFPQRLCPKTWKTSISAWNTRASIKAADAAAAAAAVAAVSAAVVVAVAVVVVLGVQPE